MEYAKNYNINSYELYSNTDNLNIQFGLNKDLIESSEYKVKILTEKSVVEITNSRVDYIQVANEEQLNLLNFNDCLK